MDLSTNQESMQKRFATKYGNHMFTMKETFEETDIKGKNYLLNSLKTETNSNQTHKPSSLFQDNYAKEKKYKIENPVFSYSSLKRAMDLRTHNRTLDGRKRTIFDDAEYFAKNFCYKLLPITLEQVDETIIQSEHNYSLSSLNSESEPEEDCSRTMDYTQVKEKNYKRRRTKFRDDEAVESLPSGSLFHQDDDRKSEVESSQVFFREYEDSASEHGHRKCPTSLERENSVPVQPLDLSAPPLVQEEKTDYHLRERSNSIVGKDDVTQLDSDKENLNSEPNVIRVTITRPDEKENYQPCDLFLNDIARLVPWLIDKDCFEVDILDRTCDRHENHRSHRLYYIISESTWRLFQGSNERVILTNDESLGLPLAKVDKDERPCYLVFDQFSLAKCLADYCKEIGGCFEYTCVEEEKEEERPKKKFSEEVRNFSDTAVETKEVDDFVGGVINVDEAKEEEKKSDESSGNQSENCKANEESHQKIGEESERDCKLTDAVKKENEKEEISNELMSKNNQPSPEGTLKEGENKTFFIFNHREKSPKETEEIAEKLHIEEIDEKEEKLEAISSKETKKQKKGSKFRRKLFTKSKANNCRITTRSKTTYGSETSQKSDNSSSSKARKKREASSLPRVPPKKRTKTSKLPDPPEPEEFRRKTRSGKMFEEIKPNRTTTDEKKRNEGLKIKRREKREIVVEKRLRSQGPGKKAESKKTTARKR